MLDSLSAGSILKGLLYFVLEPLAILSLSIYGSSCLKTLANRIVVISIYILGLIGGMMEQVGAMLNFTKSLYYGGVLASLLSPFDVIYMKMLLEMFSNVGITNPMYMQANVTGTAPSTWMMAYVLVYMAGLILLAVNRFNKRDIV